MSGGSYNYLCVHAQGLEAQRDDLEAMKRRLREFGKEGLPGAALAYWRTQQVVKALDEAQAMARRLESVWKAVEWYDSNDYGKDQLVAALKEGIDQ